MSNDPKADLIYAILAMDSYNRGYGFGIKGLEERGSKARIGGYIIGQDVNQTGWFNAGFYALAYRKGSETVISYRGTDVKGPLDSAARGGITVTAYFIPASRSAAPTREGTPNTVSPVVRRLR